MKCDRCESEKAEIETEQGWVLCKGCDSERLSRINNPESPKTLKDFKEEINVDKVMARFEMNNPII